MAMEPASKWHFFLGLPKLKLPQLWGHMTLCENLWWRWGLKQSCSPRQELSNSMLHATFTLGDWVESWILVIGSQIVKLTSGHSFGHNLCFRCLNGSCEPSLNICVLRVFQWCKELLNLMIFYCCNRSLKIRESIRTPTPKVEVHLGVWKFNSHTLPYFQPPRSMKCDSQASFLACTFTSPCLGCKSKAGVVIWILSTTPENANYWDEQLTKAMFGYRCGIQTSIKFSPLMILTRRTPQLRVDNYLHSMIAIVDDTANAKTIVEQFLQKMKLITSIHENVLLNVEQAQQKQKKTYATKKGKHLWRIGCWTNNG